MSLARRKLGQRADRTCRVCHLRSDRDVCSSCRRLTNAGLLRQEEQEVLCGTNGEPAWLASVRRRAFKS